MSPDSRPRNGADASTVGGGPAGAATDVGEDILAVEDLRVWFPVKTAGSGIRRETRWVKAVDGVDLRVRRGETLGLVGESGCGKSTTGMALLRLVEPTSGRVLLGDVDVTAAGKRELRSLRQRITMVFQDPYASLNPRRTIAASVAEPLEVHGMLSGKQAREQRVAELLEMVGLGKQFLRRHPHELSGGQRQRASIARALAVEPELIILDEPIASLDVSVQAQVMNLLSRLQRELGLTYVFIAHDLAAVQHVSDQVAVMYLGRVVEQGTREQVYEDPQHPYTRALLSAVPLPDPKKERERQRIVLTGDVPSPLSPPSGCNFRTRCPEAFDPCAKVDPALQPVGSGALAACHLHGVVARDGEQQEGAS
jgi:oligopeptide/dipeptide ABC transporter ATP-binding protein